MTVYLSYAKSAESVQTPLMAASELVFAIFAKRHFFWDASHSWSSEHTLWHY